MKKRYRFFIIIGVIVICCFFLYPTVRWYFFVPPDEQALALGTREQIRDYARRTAGQNLEDLAATARAGGALPETMSFLLNPAKKAYKDMEKPVPEEWDAASVLRAFSRSESLSLIETYHRERILKLKRLQQSAVQLGLDLSGGLSIVLQGDMEGLDEKFREQYKRSPTADERDMLFGQTLEVLNNRIDRFGLTEPVIRRQGSDQIYVEVPGAQDPERIRSIIMGAGGLSFHIVDEEATAAFDAYIREHPAFAPNEDGTLPLPGVISDDALVFGIYKKDKYGLDEWTGYAAVKKEVGLDGTHVKSATIERDNRTNEPAVVFQLDTEGGDIFYEFTGANIKKPLAIVLDNNIKSVATIQDAIRDTVRLSGGSLDMDEANNVAVVLRTAALPVKLDVVNQQSIGPSLGVDTITRGLYALLGGLGAVLVFMLLYYRTAGINAIVAQVLNIFFMFSILSAFNFTLTLPSIAGFILTIGMAVDTSVIIFERMKEELRLGKGRKAAIEAGFDKAFWAIMDSNITTLIAVLFLSQLGTGPIQGFAISLSIGIFSSVFTGLFVSRFIFDFGTDVFGSQKLSVSWLIKQKIHDSKHSTNSSRRTGRA
jgi:preprotein translocase subunit SecD